MSKKELPTTIRPMFGMSDGPRPKTDVEDKDETIRQLRASLALLEAEKESAREAQRARLAKHREKKRVKLERSDTGN